jgi:hypothetical protein
VRENVLREMTSRAVRDPNFLRQARQNLESTLARHGYQLTGEEMRLVEGLRCRTAGMTDEELARALAAGIRGRIGSPFTHPTAPSRHGAGPARPARTGG